MWGNGRIQSSEVRGVCGWAHGMAWSGGCPNKRDLPYVRLAHGWDIARVKRSLRTPGPGSLSPDSGIVVFLPLGVQIHFLQELGKRNSEPLHM